MTVEQFVLYGGLYQAMMQEQMMEAGRFRKHDPEWPCDGSLMWSYNDCWGEIGWSIIDHYGRLKPSYYAVKRACTLVKAIVRQRSGELVTRVVNDTLEAKSVEVTYGWYRIDGIARELQTRRIHVGANGMVEISHAKVNGRNPKDWVYAATISGDTSSIWKLTTYRDMNLKPTSLKVEIKGDQLVVTANTFCCGVHIPENSGAKLSDNYFDLLPGVPHSVAILVPPKDGQFSLVTSSPVANH